MNEHSGHTLTAQRRSAVARMVLEQGAVRVTDLVSRFRVNAATIRRDLNILAEQGRVRRVHGGAVAVEAEEGKGAPAGPEARIGQAVAEMIADGETVFLGPGKLPLAVARSLVGRSRLTVVTSGLEVSHWVATNTAHTVILTGGQVEGRDLGLVGDLAKGALASLRADHVILEMSGVSAVDGLTDDSLSRAEIARLLLGRGSEAVVLVPAERVGRVAAAHVASCDEVDVIVTTREAPSPALWDLSEAGVRIVLA